METIEQESDKLETATDSGAANQKTIIGLPWYSEDEWLGIREFCTDHESFFDDYDQWKREAEKAIVTITNMGYEIKMLPVYLKTFKGWCKFHRIQPNKIARKRFTNYLLKRAP